MTNNREVTLEPCPFCGGEAKRHTIGDDEPNNAGGDVICCSSCGASSHVEFGRKENLVDRWNTRASQPVALDSEAVALLHNLDATAEKRARKGGLEPGDYLEGQAAATIRALLDLAKPVGGEADALLEQFGRDKRLELTFYSPVYGDDDDQSQEWRVHRQSGSVNDREWTLLGAGETPLEAIRAALAAMKEDDRG